MKSNRNPFIILTLLAAITLAVLSTGCSSTNLAAIVSAAGTNNAAVSADINTIYGTAKLRRMNPPAGSTVTMTPDGTVTYTVPKP